jgi:hypothetical protein
MIKLRRESQEYIDSNYQGITVNEFSYFENLINEENTVIEFINSDYFKIDCKRDYIKEKSLEVQSQYLKPSFNLDKLSISDFRKVNLVEFYDFFDRYANEDWEEDGEDFKIIWTELRGRIDKSYNGYNFYLISKDWFEKAEDRLNPENPDFRLRTPEFWIYGYYFLCIAINNKENRLIEIDLFYD